jgi:YggT family protein
MERSRRQRATAAKTSTLASCRHDGGRSSNGPHPSKPTTMPLNALDFLLGVLAQTLSIYLLVLLVRVLLSWFPNLDWGNPVLSGVSAITDPYLNAFRGLIPPVGGLDLSALLAFLALQLLQSLIEGARMTLL